MNCIYPRATVAVFLRLSISIILITLSTLACAQNKVVMTFWSDANRPGYYPIPGSLDANGNRLTNPDLQAKLTNINILAYAAMGVDNQGYVHFKKGAMELGAVDKSFCLQNPKICEDSQGAINYGMGTFFAFSQLQNKQFTLNKLVSVGGSGSGSALQSALNNPQNFANSVATVVTHYQLSGVDLDFEPSGPYTAAQALEFMQLIHQLRAALGPTALITIEMLPNSDVIESINTPEWTQISNDANYVVMMGYEFHSALYHPHITGFNSNLFLPTGQPDLENFQAISDDSAISALINAGVPAHKLILGIPAYGHSYGGVDFWDHGLFQAFNFNQTPIFDEFGRGIITLRSVDNLLQRGFVLQESLQAGYVNAAYAYNKKTRQWITFEDPNSVRSKLRYVQEKQLGGVMIWDIQEDLPETDNNSVFNVVVNGL